MVYTRRDIWDLEAQQVWHPITREYALAVGKLQTGIPPTDARHWNYQAAIHGVPEGTPLKPGWDQCEHANWYFFPWHRMYLFYFESIVRSIVLENGGPSDWALPYWNYDGGGSKNTLPVPFREEFIPDTSMPNPLYVAERGTGINDGSRPLVSKITSPAAGLKTSNFVRPPRPSFGGGRPNEQFRTPGQIESTPHNNVHDALGGWMGHPETAALDPIFWLHHANIDRIWNRWGTEGAHLTPSDQDWLDRRYTFFDENGSPRTKTPKDVLSTVEQLDYRYDDDVVPIENVPREPIEALTRRPPEEMIGASERSTRLVGRAVSVPLAFDERADVRQLIEERVSDPRIVLSVEHIDAQVNPGVVYGVYLEGVDAEPVHVGNISLFGIERIHRREGVEEAHDLRLDYDVTDVVGAQFEKLRGNHVAVRFDPLTLDEADRRRAEEENEEVHAPIEVGRVSLAIG